MTAQAHEKLILDGEPTSLTCVPPLPLGHPPSPPQSQHKHNLATCYRVVCGSCSSSRPARGSFDKPG